MSEWFKAKGEKKNIWKMTWEVVSSLRVHFVGGIKKRQNPVSKKPSFIYAGHSVSNMVRPHDAAWPRKKRHYKVIIETQCYSNTWLFTKMYKTVWTTALHSG